MVHPIGWSKIVGHRLNVDDELNYQKPPAGYKNAKLEAFTFHNFLHKQKKKNLRVDKKEIEKLEIPDENDIITNWSCSSGSDENNNLDQPTWEVGMKLEAVDPLNLCCICPATVVRILKKGYLMISFDGATTQQTPQPSQSKRVKHSSSSSEKIPPPGCEHIFCYHSKSSSIQPAGFCELYGIKLTIPSTWEKRPFTWVKYLSEIPESKLAPPSLFSELVPDHGFIKGMKLEAVDLMEPSLLCVATVKNVAGRLLCVGFDGWGEEYDQWLGKFLD